jgi:hypothetical protein
MAIVIIKSDERLKWVDDTTGETPEECSGLYYRRPTSAKQREVEANHTVNGACDMSKVMEELIEWAVTGWFQIVDHTGEEIPFDKELIKSLPESFKARFVFQLYKDSPDLGN